MTLRTAQAVERPCSLYVDHGSSTPVVTQGHHVYPEFLQRRLFGRTVDETLLYLCGTCHDSVHAWLYWLLGEWRQPLTPVPPRAKALAEKAFTWFKENGG